ncbi:MAG: MarR family winged helix-turn-helix transcriptional regulator, partial [Phycisphaeraceae bacterium]
DRAGYVRRAPCPEDGRARVITLTEKGRALMDAMWPTYRAAVEAHRFVHQDQPIDLVTQWKEFQKSTSTLVRLLWATEPDGAMRRLLALPPTLSAVRDRMMYLVDDYAAGLGGPAVVGATIQVERDLESLIDAMELSNQNQEPQQPNPQEGPRQQEQREVNQILAEMRMLRIMQVATNENVVRLEDARQTGDLPQSVLRERGERVRDQQDKVRSATAELRKRAMQGG